MYSEKIRGCVVSCLIEGSETWENEKKGLDEPALFQVNSTKSPNSLFGQFKLAPMPGCCGVVVSTESYIVPTYRGSAFSESFHAIKEHVAKQLGYSLMLATIQTRNIPEIVGASKAKWKIVHCFRNKRTTNDIGVALKEI